MRVYASFPLLLAFFALVLLPHTLPARVPKRHAVTHANTHPEAQSKKRDAEAKKRLAQDKRHQGKAKRQQTKDERQQTKSQRATNRSAAHPAAARAHAIQGNRRLRPAKLTQPAANARPARQAPLAQSKQAANAADPATETRVHAWVKSQKTAPTQVPSSSALPAQAPSSQAPTAQPSTDPHTATSAGFVNAANPPAEAPQNSTGTSNPPPDDLQAAKSSAAKHDTARPTPVVSIVRGSLGSRPQLPPVEDLAAEPVILPTLYTRRGRLVVPPPLKGSHEILIRQNQVADDEGLDRIQNDDDLDRLRSLGLLIVIPSNAMLHVDERLPANRRYCRPWTALFLDTLARQHYARFQSTLQLTSAVRTVEFQQRLIHRNGNAAPAEGDTASPHLTGQAVDIGKKGLSMAEIAWLRGYLLPLVQQGKVDVEEEFQQSCFHISVYKKYLPHAGARPRSIATTHGDGFDVLATGLR